MLLPSPNPIISRLIKIQNGFTLQVPAYSGCPEKEAIKRTLLSLKLTDTMLTFAAVLL